MTDCYFITGTDTDAGKTVAAKAMLDHLNYHGHRTLAMKPVASGCEWQDNRVINADAAVLRKTMSEHCPYELTNPYTFRPAIAPHIAAALEHTPIKLDVLIQALTQLKSYRPDSLVIEGAGGWELPLGEDLTMPAFAEAANASVVIVVGMKLGCLNHAVLTERAVIDDGLTVAGWIAVDTQADKMAFRDENIKTLKQRLRSPCLGEIPYIPDWAQQNLAEYLQPFLQKQF